MKKIFAILTIAFVMTACNNSETTTTTTTTDSVSSAESPLMDAVSTADSVGKMMQDSTHQMMDSSHKK
jgi:uncharacterized lipoprotein YajG